MSDLAVKDEQFLRSINILYDAESPERISHFQPTGKSVELVKALLGKKDDRCFFIIAPYGSGKSLTACYFLQLVENRDEAVPTLKSIAERLKATDKSLHTWASERAEYASKGLVIALSGYQSNLPKAIKSAIVTAFNRNKMGRELRRIKDLPCNTMKDVQRVLGEVAKGAPEWELDHLSLVWDEFGRHIEGLVSSGNPGALDEIQTLAEFISRHQESPFTLALLLHQTILNYAGNAPQAVKKEWKKIEGRFETIQYIDDSKEIYQLIAQVMEPKQKVKLKEDKLLVAMENLKMAQVDFGLDEKGVKRLLKQAYPMEPLTLYLLPRVAARVAQNERTIFSFLHQVTCHEPLTPGDLYDYFSESMRTDTSVGGTYKQWLETESALSKVSDPIDSQVLKTTCLLSLGLSGEWARASMDLLKSSLRGWNSEGFGEERISKLLDQKLLLYRKNTDSVSLWHGTDFDLRGRLEDEKSRQEGSFSLIEYLRAEAPPEPWKPLEYNARFGLTRYFSGDYVLASDFIKDLEGGRFAQYLEDMKPIEEDGLIYYVIPQKLGDLEATRKALSSYNMDEQFVVCIPRNYKDIFQAALEVSCLESMTKDHSLLNEDPLMATELMQMLGDAQYFLIQTLEACFSPTMEASTWHHGADTKLCINAADLRSFLSEIMAKVFKDTPIIKNEMFVRRRVRQGLVNSRKKLLFAILDNAGLKDFRLEGYTPDVSLFRTMLLHTGLYRPVDNDEEHWRFADLGELEDQGLGEVWGRVKEFFTKPAAVDKKITDLFNILKLPPFGVREALLPVFFTAGLKAFPAALTISQKGMYLQDVLPSTIEDILKSPEEFTVRVHGLQSKEKAYLEGVISLFGGREKKNYRENDLLRRVFDTLTTWKATVGPAALQSKTISEQSKEVQKLLNRESNPYRLFFEELPKVLKREIEDYDELLSLLETAKNEMESVKDVYYQKAASALRNALNLLPGPDAHLVKQVADWGAHFPKDVLDGIKEMTVRALHTRATMPYDDARKLIDSLASLIVGRPVPKWDDATALTFEKELHGLVLRFEEQVSQNLNMAASGAVKTMAPLVTNKARLLFLQLRSMVGMEEAKVLWNRIVQEGDDGSD